MGSKPKLSGLSSLKSLSIAIAISGIFLYLTFVIFFIKFYSWPACELFSPLRHIFPCSQITPSPNNSPTSVNHIVFGLIGLGSIEAWRHRKNYIESWWRPNVTRGYLYLDTVPPEDLLPWPATSPPFRLCDDISKLVDESRLKKSVFKMVHVMLEIHREGDKDVRWFVMGDDDSIFFVDNWADVLSKYDHTKYVYIGGHSESLQTNLRVSFDQGYGGGGIAMSYALVSALVKDLEGCLKRYPNLKHFDLITRYCVDELGVSLSAEKGIHQIDLRGDISGFLSSHPQAPLLSLHHFDVVNPIFPSMNRTDSAKHLMKSANVDQSRLLQQTICYHRQTQWSVSVSWGYSVHIYEKVFPRSILKRPLETFRPWTSPVPPPRYMFNTRELPFRDPSCEAPHVFFMESVEKIGINQIVSTYVRSRPRGLPPCFKGNNSTDYISTVRVLSPATKPVWGDRSECCDVIKATDNNTVDVKYRACVRDEIVG